MYKYQCSKQECGSTWTLNEGCLNGFVLTCPVCGKGRGLFVAQTKRQMDRRNNEKVEEIIISINSAASKSVEEVNKIIEDFGEKYSLEIVSKNIESVEKEIVCTLLYRIKN